MSHPAHMMCPSDSSSILNLNLLLCFSFFPEAQAYRPEQQGDCGGRHSSDMSGERAEHADGADLDPAAR